MAEDTEQYATESDLEGALADQRLKDEHQDEQQDLLGQGNYHTARYLTRLDGGWDDPDVQDLRRVTNALNPGTYTFDDLAPGYVPPQPPSPSPTGRYFGVWNGVNLRGTLAQIAERVKALVPADVTYDRIEWYPKAGEGGSWQSSLSDPHGLSGPGELADWFLYMQERGISLVPYVVNRGNPAWNAGEWEQIAQCALITGRCINNLEPPGVIGGRKVYWNGPLNPAGVAAYLDGLRAAMRRIGADGRELELCAIPRWTQVAELGGAATLRTWLAGMSSASWECYEDAPAPSLAPGYAIPNVVQTLTDDPREQIPLVQRSMIGRYAASEWARNGMEVWYLDGDL